MESGDSNFYDEGVEFYDKNDYKNAIIKLKEAVSKNPKDSDAWFTLGLSYARSNEYKNDYKNAIESYQKAVDIDPNYSEAWYNLGIVLYDKALFENNKEGLRNAINCYDKALTIEKKPNYLVRKGLAEDQTDQKENALNSYEESTMLFPEYAIGWYNKGYLLYNLRRFEEAKKSFEKLIDLEPNNDNAWYYLGLTYYKLNDSKKSYKSFMQALRLDPRKRDTYEEIGRSFESSGMIREAAYFYQLFRNIENEILDFTITRTSQDIIPDLWISKDELGYDIYANAIAGLLANVKETPIAISIQAPWGAGKTSLMRVVQGKIDLDGTEAYNGKFRAKLTYKLKDLKALLKTIIRESREELEKSKSKSNNDSIHEEQIIGLQKKKQETTEKKFISIWFDPWEYENTEQLWAGLADSMIHGLVNRMSAGRRQLFLLQLNLGIYDLKGLLNWMRSFVLEQTWKKFRPWLFVTVGGLVASGLSIAVGNISNDPTVSVGGLAGFAITFLQAGINFFRNNSEMENLASNFALDEYLKIPDYSDKLGKTHEAMEDIKRIILATPDEYKPLVIFIDDLDRCSPNGIASLFEGVNQFISSNFKDCIFVIGMDNQVVASALDVLYKDIIEKLPEYLLQLQLGWRYLEKFIQLPILIPPTNKDKFRSYIGSLISPKNIVKAIDNTYENVKINSQISTYGNEETGVEIKDIEKLSYAAYIFSNNPRDVKRFLNLVTYYSTLRSQIKSRNPGSELPTYDQIRRWIILILKWPSLAQWLYWTQDPLSYSISSDALISPSFRLKQLETIALESKSQKDWEDKISSEFYFVNPKSIPWIVDANVHEFFRDEKNQNIGSKISDGAGLGIY